MATIARISREFKKATHLGGRNINLDRAKIMQNFADIKGLTFLSVLDGSMNESVVNYFDATFSEWLKASNFFRERKYKEALVQVLSIYDDKLSNANALADINLLSTADTQGNPSLYAGATVSICLIDDNKIYYVNSGDIRIIVIGDDDFVCLSSDHFPFFLDSTAQKRLKKLGAKISVEDPSPSGKITYDNATTLVSSNVGHLRLKEIGILKLEINSGVFQFDEMSISHLLIMTDSCYRQLDTEGVCRKLLAHVSLKPQVLCDKLVDIITRHHNARNDNVTMVLGVFKTKLFHQYVKEARQRIHQKSTEKKNDKNVKNTKQVTKTTKNKDNNKGNVAGQVKGTNLALNFPNCIHQVDSMETNGNGILIQVCAITPFFGCKISLISKSEIRYEGILYTIDPKESTIALAKVRSFGSEDRPVERPVPPRDDVFEFIIFRASDIKDLIVDDPPPTPALTDPAIIQAHSTSTSFPSSFPQASINAAAPAAVAPVGPTAPQQTPIQQLQQAKGSGGPTGGVSVPKQNETHTDSKSKNATSSNAPPNYSRAAGGGGGSVSQQQTRQPNQRQNLQFNKQQQNKPSGEQSQQSSQAPNRSNNQQPQQNAQNQNGYVRRNQQNQSHGPSQQNRVIGENQNPNYHARNGGQQQNQGGFRPFNSQHRFTPRQGQGQQQPQQHQFSGGFRRGGGPGGVSSGPRNFISRPLNQHNGPKFPPLPDGDFDFEKAQADFKILEEKLHALKLNGSLGEVAEGPSADTTDVVVPGIPASAISVAALEQEEQELPKEACYNKQKSFFDQISCEALEREKGSSHRVDWKQERKMNRETFGAVSARRPTFFRVNNRGGGFGGGYHQHRGGYYNQRGGSGGYYQNRNYQNRQPRSQNAPGAGGSNNVSSTTNSTRTPAKSTPNGVGASPSSSAAPIAIATKN